VAERCYRKMTKLYPALVLAIEAAAIVLLWFVTSGFPVLLLIPILPLTLVAALILRHVLGSPAYRARRLSPEAIATHQAPEDRDDTPEELSHRIVERADEIHRTLLESPSEIQVEMCALGYRACVNDMITLTHLINEETKSAGPIKRLKLRMARRRATDSLSRAREAMPPGASRATRPEH
jgi:hypothetical protein